ncbi:MAG: 2-methylcitrate dehydratase [Rhodobacteraceae bacterium]|nr:2-methylcitrate dehydratase [Paracoccaceae bacterium]
MKFLDEIVSFILKQQELPDTSRHVLRLSFLDWSAVAWSGQNEPISLCLRNLAEEEAGANQSFAFGVRQKVPARMAALVNGTTSHALDYDDTHFASLGHPSVTVFPAILALADQFCFSMEEVKTAALIGAEVAIRVGIWLGRTHYRAGFHITATAGIFGSVAGCARLMNLTPNQTRMALGIAGSRAAGVKAQFGTMGKPLHAGMAASAGVEAIILARNGLISSSDGFDGPHGFVATHQGEQNLDALEGFGKVFLFEQVSHKFHACCHGSHAMIEAIKKAKSDTIIKPESVEKIEITVHPQYLNICNINKPKTGLEAKFSFSLIAAAVLHGVDTGRLDVFNENLCKDREVCALADKVEVITNEGVSETATKILIKKFNSQIIESYDDILTPFKPIDREGLVRKKAAKLLGFEFSDRIWNMINDDYLTGSKLTKILMHTPL